MMGFVFSVVRKREKNGRDWMMCVVLRERSRRAACAGGRMAPFDLTSIGGRTMSIDGDEIRRSGNYLLSFRSFFISFHLQVMSLVQLPEEVRLQGDDSGVMLECIHEAY